MERASVDEAFIDLTDEVVRRLSNFSASEQFQNTVVVGYDATGDIDRSLQQYSENNLGAVF